MVLKQSYLRRETIVALGIIAFHAQCISHGFPPSYSPDLDVLFLLASDLLFALVNHVS